MKIITLYKQLQEKNDYTSKEQQQRVEWNGETNPGCENGVW